MGAFFGTKQHGQGGERDASSESPIGCDFEGGEGKKKTLHFQHLHGCGRYTRVIGGLKLTHN